MKRNIVLIGFMASGKGRTARELYSQTGYYAVDTDDMIESLAKMKIRKIFKKYGEDYFRDLERNTALWLQKNVKNSVISTGGGFVMVPNIKKIGIVVHLFGTFDSILESVIKHPNAEKKIKKRPLLRDAEQARTLYEKRLPLYRQAADLEIKADGKTTTEVAYEIINKLSLKLRKGDA